MKAHILLSCVLAMAACTSNVTVQDDSRSPQRKMFEDGNYAMFIHFGLYSHLESQWKDKAYYGNAEWIMYPTQAGIPVDEYMALAGEFNPSNFDADEIVSVAKDAGMKYIVITSKHHEGFAMFDSDVCDFNIKDATPFGRDVIGELADACHRNGLGIGFYYSQFQDWTAPGGGRGPQTDAEGNAVSFDEYFRTKCVPQVEEITTKYGEIELIWFDTPGDMDIKYSEQLVELVHKNQPGTLVSSRVGNGLGDYETLGDMEVPVGNVPGLWEGIDVMQVGWGYSKFDKEWKSPQYVLQTLLSTVARGGTFMMNIGPKADGSVPEKAAENLRKAGTWVKKYPFAVYGAQASPWGHALPWGDAVVNNGKLYLLVYQWPEDGKLVVPGLGGKVCKARIAGGKRLRYVTEDSRTILKVPYERPDELVSVIELTIDGEMSASDVHTVMDGYSTVISSLFAKAENCKVSKQGWMLRYGEWKTQWLADGIGEDSRLTWTVDIPCAGDYDLALQYKGEGLVEAVFTNDEGKLVRNCQPVYDNCTWQRWGLMHFDTPGVHEISLSFLSAQYESLKILDLKIN